MGAGPSFGPPNQGGCWSNPSAQEPAQEPCPPMLLQSNVLLGRNDSRAKSKPRFFLGWQTTLQFSHQTHFRLSQGSCPAASVQPVPLSRGGSAPRFYCHKVIIHFWSVFCHSNYNDQGFNQTNKRIFYSTLGMLISLLSRDNPDGAAVTTAAHTAALSSRTALCGPFGRTYSKYWLCQANMGSFLPQYVLIMKNLLGCSYQQGFRSEWRGDT